jgi:hypothetical protein
MKKSKAKKQMSTDLLSVERLTDGDRIALASIALAILELPSPMQQYSNARDMLDILAGEPCWRAGYILGQAHHVVNAFSGFSPDGHKDREWDRCDEWRADVGKLVGKALAKRRELIADEEAFRVSDEGNALVASLRERGESKAEKTA